MYPKVNQRIGIEIIDEGVVYHSIIADMGETEILISHPMAGNTIGLFQDGAPIAISYVIDETKYQFKALIIGKKKDKIPLLRVTKPLESDISKIQMRDNFRVECNLRIQLDEIELHTINISAGGMLFSCTLELPFNVGDEVSGNLFISDTASIPFKGVIKRIYELDNMTKHVAMQFTVLDRKDEAKIVQFCFQKQRQMRSLKQSSKFIK